MGLAHGGGVAPDVDLGLLVQRRPNEAWTAMYAAGIVHWRIESRHGGRWREHRPFC